LKIYNTKGQLVRTLINNESYNPGFYNILWNGKDNFGHNVSTGIYLYYLNSPNFNMVKKMTILK